MTAKTHFKFLGKSIAISIFDTPNLPTLGITNECQFKPTFRLFLDYDHADYEIVCKDIIFLHENWHMCNFTILTTNEETITNAWNEPKLVGNYHVISCDILPWNQLQYIISLTRCDKKFSWAGSKMPSRNLVLRILAKYQLDDHNQLKEFKPEPKLKDIIHFPSPCPYKHCFAQFAFLQKWYNVNIPLANWDSCNKLEYIHYSTIKKR